MTTDLQDIPPAGTPVPSSPAGASVDVSVAGPPPGPGTAEARPVEESDGDLAWSDRWEDSAAKISAKHHDSLTRSQFWG